MREEKIKEGIYKGAVLYGPYYRKDGRQHVVLTWHDNKNRIIKKKSISYPKFLVERQLNRKLKKDETIDHIDRDFNNNDLSNLRIIERSKHAQEDAIRLDLVEVKCIDCGKKMLRRAGQLHRNSILGMAGPFCKKCGGKYGAEVQHSKREKLPPQPNLPKEKRNYYKLEKEI